MPLYKPGKEHTINFIYCWTAGTKSLSDILPLIPKGWRDSSLGSGRVKMRWARPFPRPWRESQEWGDHFRPFVSPSCPP